MSLSRSANVALVLLLALVSTAVYEKAWTHPNALAAPEAPAPELKGEVVLPVAGRSTPSLWANQSSCTQAAATPTPIALPPRAARSQPRKGICNWGKGAYPCLLTEDAKTCPTGTHASLYRSATCAPCVAGSIHCPCARALYECQRWAPAK